MVDISSNSANSGFVGIKFCQEWFVNMASSCFFFLLEFISNFSNNMLYPKEDKENRILLYSVNIRENKRFFSSVF